MIYSISPNHKSYFVRSTAVMADQGAMQFDRVQVAINKLYPVQHLYIRIYSRIYSWSLVSQLI